MPLLRAKKKARSTGFLTVCVLDELFGEVVGASAKEQDVVRIMLFACVFHAGFRKERGVNDHWYDCRRRCATDTSVMRRHVWCCTILSERLIECRTMSCCG